MELPSYIWSSSLDKLMQHCCPKRGIVIGYLTKLGFMCDCINLDGTKALVIQKLPL